MRRALLSAVLAIAAAACASTRPVAVANRSALSDADVTRWARLLAVSDVQGTDTLVVDDALGANAASAVRRAAALSVGQNRVAARYARLRALLTDADSGVAASAAFALGLARDSSSVAALVSTLQGRPTVAIEAAWSLGEIGAPARASIVSALADSLPDAVRASAIYAASRLRPVPVADIARYADARAPLLVLRAATYALSRTRQPSAVRTLLALASSADAEVRASVARALSRGGTGDSLAAPALTALATLAADRDAQVRVNSARALGTHGAFARASLVGALRDADANVRISAAQSVATAFAADTSAWRDAWAADTGFMFRRSLLASAVAARMPLSAIAMAGTAPWATHADWRYRASVAEAAGAAPDWTAGYTILRPLVADRDGRVRAAAYGSLTAFADSAVGSARAERRALALGGLRDTDFYARATVLGWLADSARVGELPAVLAAYAAARADSGNDARIAAARYVARAWRADSTSFSDSLRAVLALLAPPADPLERAEVVDVAPLAAWRTARAVGRPDAWYDGAVRGTIAPAMRNGHPRATIETERGTIAVELFAIDAPLTVLNFRTLARAGYLDGTRFHRVVPNFVAQDGDPRGDGNGGPGFSIRDELNRRRYARGAIGMALSGPDTGGSQYFLTLSPQPHLDGHYTVFARVVDGWAAMDALVQGDRILRIVAP